MGALKIPLRTLSTRRRLRGNALILVSTALVGLAPTVDGRWAAAVHDSIGWLVAPPEMPVVVVHAEDPASAVETVRAAGAAEVWVALPPGDPRVGTAHPDPGTLRAGGDGRIRFADAVRLPLPEALAGVLHLDAAQLGGGTPSALLTGRTVVLVWTDPAVGRREAVPGTPAPVDRGEVLAVALGTAATGAGLRVLPLPVAMGLVAALAGACAWGLARLLPTPGVLAVAGGSALVCAGAVAARSAGLDLPVGGLLVALGIPLVARLAIGVTDTIHALDRLQFSLAPRGADAPVPTGLAALPAMAALHLPGVIATVWRRGEDGRPERLAEVGGAGPPLTALPQASDARSDLVVEPVREAGDVVGALVLSAPTEGTLPADAARLAGVLARQLHAEGALVGKAPDPWIADLEAPRVEVGRAVARAERWEAYLEASAANLGAFGVAGELLAGSARMRAAAGDGTRAPLLAALSTLARGDEDTLRDAVRAVFAGEPEARIPGVDDGTEVVVTALGAGARRSGVLVQVHDVSAHRRRDALHAAVITATNARARNALTAIVGYTGRLVETPDEAGRRALAARIDTVVEQQAALFRHGDQLVGTDADGAAREPVYLHDCVAAVVRSLAADRRARLSVELPEDGAAVSARGAALARCVNLLLTDATEGARARVSVAPEADGMVLRIEDDGGGLPQPMLDRLVDADPRASAPAAARRIVDGMGGRFSFIGTLGVGNRFEIRLRYY